ncbi:rod shape-determining protein RodA [Clostridium sp. CAG:508]|jgi:rod shape determining protein RodA|nr:rod shape-determining protein RodA [Clostridium sp. CAG:508]
MQKKMFKNFEWGILICTIILLAIGLVALFSATQNSDYEEFKKQIMWIGISIPVIVVVILVDYEILAKISPVIYGLSLISLVAVLFTEPINGATSWFNIGPFSFQPAEFAKIAVVLFMANVIVKLQQKGRDEINRFWKLGIILATVAVPTLLIIKQPDYGTALAFLVALIFMLYVAGINKKYIITAVLLVVILVPLAYFFILPEHAKARIDVYLNPNLDPRGDGYNIIQSKLAIGAGQIFGMGLFKGNQTQLGYLYPKTTDFIFAVISEEMGFVVAGAIIVLYVILITKSIQVAKTAKDDLGSYIATGIVGIFFFHMLENIGMTMGLLPITGIPLPFVSYGGSSMLTNLTLIAILLNISTRRKKAMFIE